MLLLEIFLNEFLLNFDLSPKKFKLESYASSVIRIWTH